MSACFVCAQIVMGPTTLWAAWINRQNSIIRGIFSKKTRGANAVTPREKAYEAPPPTSQRLSSVGGGEK